MKWNIGDWMALAIVVNLGVHMIRFHLLCDRVACMSERIDDVHAEICGDKQEYDEENEASRLAEGE